MLSLSWKCIYFFINIFICPLFPTLPWNWHCHCILNWIQVQEKSKQNTFSICHWNLNSITIHNFSKLTQLKAYISTYKHDFICLSETYLDSSIPDNLIDIKGYNLVRADHLDNIKRGEVCIYYKESLSLFESELCLTLKKHYFWK